jgi:hypothetical protein
MDAKLGTLAAFFAAVSCAWPQSGGSSQPRTVPLIVPAGVPLRIYLTKRIAKRAGAPVQGKLLEPVYAFDREVIPAGAVVSGTVSQVDPVSRSQRARAIFAGDFTPLHIARIEFTSVRLPDGREMPLRTVESEGLGTVVPLHPVKKKSQAAPANSGGVLSAGKQQVKDQVNAQIDAVKSIPDIVRAPGKKERVEDFLLAKLPYHPQYLRNGTRFDAELANPLTFGSEAAPQGSLALLGSQPSAESLAHTRLITPLDSRNAKQGDPVAVELTAPLFSPDHKLVLPEGTRLDGTVVVARPARWFHRAGRLRFNFQQLTLPAEVAELKSTPAAAPRRAQQQLHVRTQATLKAAEGGKAPIKVDSEGGVQAKESKTRFIGTAVAVMLARRAGDFDAQRNSSGAVIGQNPNVGGRTIGGGFGFGLLGAAAAQSSRYVGAAFGYYGLMWTVFSTVIARGAEVRFAKNAVIDIGFNPRTPAAQGSSRRSRQASGK